MSPPPVEVDPVELVAALLRRDRGMRCALDRRSGEVHRSIDECDPEEDDRRFDDLGRYAPIDALGPEASRAFWERVAIARFSGASGLYQPLSDASSEERARLLEVVRDVTREWLADRAIEASLRARE